ncbi:hypothetical protein D3C73_1578570 [compost metagenome]
MVCTRSGGITCMPSGGTIFTGCMLGSAGAATSVFWRSTCSVPNIVCSMCFCSAFSGIRISSIFI